MKTSINSSAAMFTLLFVIIIAGICWINHLKSDIDYLDVECLRCGSVEVLDFGYDDHMGGQHGHCPDCGCDFYVETYNE